MLEQFIIVLECSFLAMKISYGELIEWDLVLVKHTYFRTHLHYLNEVDILSINNFHKKMLFKQNELQSYGFFKHDGCIDSVVNSLVVLVLVVLGGLFGLGFMIKENLDGV